MLFLLFHVTVWLQMTHPWAPEVRSKTPRGSSLSLYQLHQTKKPVPAPPRTLTVPNAGANKPSMARDEPDGQTGALNAKTHLADISDLSEKAEKVVNLQVRTQVCGVSSLMLA